MKQQERRSFICPMMNFMKSMKNQCQTGNKKLVRGVYLVPDSNPIAHKMQMRQEGFTDCSTIREDGLCSTMKADIIFTCWKSSI